MATNAVIPASTPSFSSVVVSYLKDLEQGQAPPLQELLARYPTLADELRAFFAGHERLSHLSQVPPVSCEISRNRLTALVRSDAAVVARFHDDYELLEELDHGPRSIVYRARHTSTQSIVALKVLLVDRLLAEADRRRFRHEATLATRLAHPHLVPLLHSGIYEVEPGVLYPYWSMPWMECGNLAQLPSSYQQDPRATVRLLIPVARAVHYLHQRGLLPCNLKPGNLFLDRTGQFRLANFGLPRPFDAEMGPGRAEGETETPEYLAPEQAAAQQPLTTAVDVWGLGAILYALLTGRPPFRGITALETLHQVIGQEPVPPRTLNGLIDRDLEAICLKCLAKEPEKRFASAEELARDLEHFLAGEPVLARPIGPVPRLFKWSRRRPLAAVGVLAVGLLLGMAGLFLSERGEPQQADMNGPGQLAESTAADCQRQREQYRRSLLKAQLLRVTAIWERDPERARQLLADKETCPPELRNYLWHFHDDLCRTAKPLAFRQPEPEQGVHPPGSDSFPLRLLRSASHASSAVLLPRSKWTAVGRADGLVELLPGEPTPTEARDLPRDDKPSEPLVLLAHTGFVSAVDLSAVGQTLATASHDGSVKLWDLDSFRERATLRHASEVWAVAISPSGETLASGSDDGTVTLWDVGTGKELVARQGHPGPVLCLAFSPDGKTLASGSGVLYQRGEVRLWEATKLQEQARLEGHADLVRRVTWSADGHTLATGSLDGAIKLWDVAQSAEKADLKGPRAAVCLLAFAPDGQWLASASTDNLVQIWKLVPGQPVATAWKQDSVPCALTASPDGRFLAVLDANRTGHFWEIGGGPVTPSKPPRTPTRSAEQLRADGDTWANACKWDEAAAAYAQAFQVEPQPIKIEAWQRHGLLRLKIGDKEGFQKVCRDLLDWEDRNKNIWHKEPIARVLGAAPIPVAQQGRILQMARDGVDNVRDQGCTHFTLGCVLYRVGRIGEARAAFAESLKQEPTWSGVALNHLMVALILLDQKQLELARAEMVKARAWMRQGRAETETETRPKNIEWHDWLQSLLLRAEVEKRLAQGKP